MKDVFDATKLKSCANLAKWKDSITNMLWWSFATCRKYLVCVVCFENKKYSLAEDEEDLREKILSITLHCSNHHHFRNNRQHKQCAHGPLNASDRTKPWLKEGSKVCSNFSN